jgi:hypothetical protein
MNKTIIITEHQSLSLINEEDNVEYIELTPDEYKRYLKMVSYDGRLLYNIPKFRGKKIIINKQLDLSGLPVKDLGPIVINGGLDISRTKISSLDNVDIRSRGWIADWDTPMRKMRERREFLAKVAEQQSKREDGEWDENSELDMVGLCANALFKYLVRYEQFEPKEPGDDEKLEQYRNRIEEIESIEGYDENDELVSEVETLTEEIEEIEKRIDVYNLNYIGKHYKLLEFSVLHQDNESHERYAVGDYDDTNATALSRAEDYIDEVGIENMDKNFVGDYIDEEEFRDYFREGEEEYVRDNIEYIFDEDDFEYSEEVQERIDVIEARLEDSEIDSDEEDELREELDELKDSEKTVSEDLIESKVEEMLNDKADDMMATLIDYGIEFDQFVNKADLAQGMVDADGFGHTISSYDGNEHEVEFQGETYYIFQTEG